MNSAFNQDQSTKYFSIFCVSSVVGLLTVWVLPNTIALRHVFIGIGLLSSIAIIVKSKFFQDRKSIEVLPLILFSLIFIWAILHFTFFSLNPELEWQELKSTWLRSLAGAIIAIGLSIALRIHTFLKPYFFISLFIVSWINLGAYLYLSYESGNFILPINFVEIFVFKKIEAAFFGVIAISIACANLVELMSKRFDKKNSISIFLWLLGIMTAIVSALVANTKNGIAIALGLCVLLASTILFKALFRKTHSRLGLIVSALFISLLLIGSWNVHTKFAAQGWNTMWEDAKISSQLEQHNFWRTESQRWTKVVGETFPKNSYGIPVAGNTYQRVAWATAGLNLIFQYPMGYGSINRSFVGLLNHANVQQTLQSQTHSGWIDFGLAFGVPGLLILFAVFFSIFYRGFSSSNQFGLVGVWIALGLIPFGVVAEICYKHNFEILFFYIAFAATSTISIRNAKVNAESVKIDLKT